MTARRTAPCRTREFYDGISRAYDLIADSSEHAARNLGLRALGVSSGERVLEVGCGTGHTLVSLAGEVGPTGRVDGDDVSSGMMAVASNRLACENVTLTIGGARVLCFRSSAFDAVFMSFTLELFERAMPDVLSEVKRVLCIEGRLGTYRRPAPRRFGISLSSPPLASKHRLDHRTVRADDQPSILRQD